MNDKNICIISPSLKMGGIERALVVLANNFSDEGYKVTFVCCLKGQHFYSLRNNINLIEPGLKHNGGAVSGVTFYPRLAWFIRRQVKKTKPDAVLAFGDWFSPLVLLALVGTKYPVFISDRTSPDYNFKFPIPQLKKWLYPKSSGFIAQTKRAADYKKMQFGNKLNIRVIPNALREVQLYPEIKRENIILYVGRFAWEKGPERLIKAFANIGNPENWKLLMAGSGPLLADMKKLATELKIKDKVIFPGQVTDVDRLYARASIYVLPSVLEGFPNSLCEAMAAGLPCLCFDSIPHEAIMTHKFDGLIIEKDNTEKLGEELLILMNNEQERTRLGSNAKQIRERLHIDSVAKQVLHFIETK